MPRTSKTKKPTHFGRAVGRSHARTALAFVPSVPSSSALVLRQSTSSATAAVAPLPNGLIKTITQFGSGEPVRLGDIATVEYSCFVVGGETGDTETAATLPFAQSPRQKMVVGDGSMIDGWDKALRTMTVGEKCLVRIVDPSLAYGSTGFLPIIPPNAILQLDLHVLDSQAASMNIDFDSLADTADNTPRTATDIAAAFAIRQAAAASEPQLDGVEWAVAKIKSFYFFGLFEGETGQQAPWFLRPSITFPLAFAIVGVAFYVSFASGAITERGAQRTDELDDIILVSSALFNTNQIYQLLLTGFTW